MFEKAHVLIKKTGGATIAKEEEDDIKSLLITSDSHFLPARRFNALCCAVHIPTYTLRAPFIMIKGKIRRRVAKQTQPCAFLLSSLCIRSMDGSISAVALQGERKRKREVGGGGNFFSEDPRERTSSCTRG